MVIESRADTNPADRHRGRWISLLPMFGPWLLLFGLGLWGLDFGVHWDEPKHIGAATRTLETGVFLPGEYLYPSMTYWLTLACAAPDAVMLWIQDKPAKDIVAFVQSNDFLLRARAATLFVSSLTVIWVYLSVWLLRRQWPPALFAATLVALSWEVGYHLRWLAPDGLLMQWSALTLLLAIAAIRYPARASLVYLTAVAAALACSTKYPAGLMLLLPMIALWVNRPLTANGVAWSALISRAIRVVGCFAVVVFMITPGIVLDRHRFAHSLAAQLEAYGGSWPGFGSNVPHGLPHLQLMLSYLVLDLFSPYTVIAAIAAILAVVGAWWAWRRHAWTAAALTIPPTMYILYFSMQGLMFPRNTLVAVPFLAVCAGLGAAYGHDLLRGRLLKTVFVAACVVAMGINAWFVITAAHSINTRSPAHLAQQTAAYIDNHPQEIFYVSPRVWDELQQFASASRPNVTRDPGQAQSVLFHPAEAFNNYDWPANRRRMTRGWFGPYEVNFNYYAGWIGADRILLMSVQQAKETRVPFMND